MLPLASIGDWKTISDIASNVVTIAAVGFGGAWAYWRFVRERTRWPRAELELVVTHCQLTEERTLLNATVKIRNAGAGLMKTERDPRLRLPDTAARRGDRGEAHRPGVRLGGERRRMALHRISTSAVAGGARAGGRAAGAR